jgi:hypothetical protein
MGPRAQAFSFAPYEIATPMYIYIYTLFTDAEDRRQGKGKWLIQSWKLIWFVRETAKTFIHGIQQCFLFVSNYLLDKYMFGWQDIYAI